MAREAGGIFFPDKNRNSGADYSAGGGTLFFPAIPTAMMLIS